MIAIVVQVIIPLHFLALTASSAGGGLPVYPNKQQHTAVNLSSTT